jgi:phenylacetate-coenzyme A ligase PaaK-like adenylate-forming protein
MSDFSRVKKICEINEPLHWTSEKNEAFYAACREIGSFHNQKNEVVKRIYSKFDFDPLSIQTEADLERIPAVGVTAMKYHLLLTLPPETMVLKLTSSGTRGQKTQIWFDQGSLDRVQRMMDVYFEQEGFVSKNLNNYFIFNYDPDDAGDLGIAYTEKNQMRFAPIHEQF